MEDYIIRIIMYGLISWSCLFIVMKKILYPKRSLDFCNRCVSIIHALLAVAISCFSIQDWNCPVCPLASKSSPIQMKTLAMSLSYMIYDLFCCQYSNVLKLDSFIHHFVSIVGFATGLIYKRCGSEMVAALLITEMSSPFLHLRELLKELGYKDTILNLAADVSFAVIFTVARMVGGPYLTYLTLSANNPLLIKAMALGLELVSVFWFYKIVKMMKYKLSRFGSLGSTKAHKQ
ncbi:TLC domain-containing protein 5-like [Impatiens glandulifera]|uniref:TLC domain-containing protein 5-like n=1 Tax=Impatiens glandulifera TaxID=253017 RepID=UPI001FB16956|nr:TLC domain-containing protein 5-like [Impatiens glandulifera]